MTVEWASVIVSVVTLVVTLATSLAIVSYKTGQNRQRITELEQEIATKAAHTDLVQIKEALAEIKGMFVLRLRE